MLRRKCVGGLALLALVSLTAGCNSGVISTTTPTTPKAGVTVFVSDSPACNVLSYRTVFTGMTLVSAGGGKNAAIFPGGVGGAFVRVNFGELRDMTTILRTTTIPVGTYNQAVVFFGPAQFSFYDPTSTPPVKIIFPAFSDSTRTYNIDPPLTAVQGGIYGLRVDLNVDHSVGVDSQGNLNGDVPPAINLTHLTPTVADGFGRLQDMRGFVLSVTNGSTLTQFIGALNIQILSGSSDVPVVAVNISQDTTINGVTATSKAVAGILGGSFVEVDGYVNAQGFLVARSVEVEDQEDTSQNRLGAIGYITSITRDPSGNATQLTLYVSDEQPEATTILGTDSFAQVDVSASTKFQNAAQNINFALLPFDATSLQIGQEVVVHGTISKGAGNTVTISANSIYLLPQSHQGSFTGSVQIGSDNKTGAFYMKPCATLFQGSPILVVTNNDTAFVNLPGLSGLNPQPALNVKGLLFYEDQGVTANGIAVPPGTLVMVADEVHELP